jgi:hypothetical protein
MKIKSILFAIVIVGAMGACTQKLCPTYANVDTEVDINAPIDEADV